jgi:hypothetical protein
MLQTHSSLLHWFGAVSANSVTYSFLYTFFLICVFTTSVYCEKQSAVALSYNSVMQASELYFYFVREEVLSMVHTVTHAQPDYHISEVNEGR